MTNNRLYLCHRPTGEYICLSKRGTEQWNTPWDIKQEEINDFFAGCDAGSFDDFILLMEGSSDDPDAPYVHCDWSFQDEGKRRIVLGPSIAYVEPEPSPQQRLADMMRRMSLLDRQLGSYADRLNRLEMVFQLIRDDSTLTLDQCRSLAEGVIGEANDK